MKCYGHNAAVASTLRLLPRAPASRGVALTPPKQHNRLVAAPVPGLPVSLRNGTSLLSTTTVKMYEGAVCGQGVAHVQFVYLYCDMIDPRMITRP